MSNSEKEIYCYRKYVKYKSLNQSLKAWWYLMRSKYLAKKYIEVIRKDLGHLK